MKIVFLAWRDLANPLAGGSEVLVDRLASGLTDRGHDVTLVAGGPVADRSYRVVDAGSRFGQYLRAPGIVEGQLRDADLVVDVANGMSYLTPLWRRRPSVCFVNHVHTDQWRLWFGPALAGVGRTIERSVTPRLYRHRLFVAVSASTATALEGIGVHPEQIRVVPNGVDIAPPAAATSPEPLFVTLGRLVPHKRIDVLLPLWERVRAQVGGRLVVIGDGPEAPRLRALAGAGVDLVGHVSEAEKQRLLAEAWLLVHPSMLEGWGLVVTEAAAAGTPSLAFDAPGVRDSIAHGESGLLSSDADDLVANWVELARNTQLRNDLAAGALRRAARFTWDNTVDRFLEVANEAVARSRHALPRPAVPMRTRPVAAVPALATPTRQTPPDVSIIVPAFNEAGRLPESLPRLIAATKGLDTELIVVDDGSTDGTGDVAADLLRDASRPSLLRLLDNRGKGAAVRTGVAHATGRRIVFMDADMATDLEHMEELLAALDHAHVAMGSRAAAGSVTTGASYPRAVMGRSFNRLARVVTGAGHADFQCGFKAFQAPVAKVLFGLSQVDGYAFDAEILGLAHRIGYSAVEVPVRWHAVEGSHVRLLRDGPLMGASVLASRLRWTGSRSLAALRAAGPGEAVSDRVAEVLAMRLPNIGPVVPWQRGALALLPFVDDARAARAAVEVQHDLPEFDVRSDRLAARLLLAPDAHALRSAIAAA